MNFDFALAPAAPLRDAIDLHYREAEALCVARLAEGAAHSDTVLHRIRSEAARLVTAVRAKRARSGGVDALMREFSLSSEEGVALMCLAEALLRIPDAPTRDALIRDKIGGGDWHAHVGRSPSLFVNAASWGLLVTGKLVSTHSADGLSAALARLVGKGGEPLIRKGVDLAMRMLGRQFVTGETIESAIANGSACRARGYRYSYDMLGEAALTATDAQRYYTAYETAIHAIGAHARTLGLPPQDAVRLGPGISVKLSALHPRYSRAQRARVMAELLPRLTALARLACAYRIGLNIDAEESERLDLSLDLLEALAHDPDLNGWNGLGFVIQAYQKRAPFVIDYVIDLARRTSGATQRSLMVRLVKGAYWDSEIKRAQVDGQPDYPVYTRKVHTDVAYQACARKLLGATDVLYPQFATHNAYTLAWVRESARVAGVPESAYEFQCLHGMGETLYDQVIAEATPSALSCRIYAPVGTHETLLAYLVRRLLENGANSSFVNRIVDASVSIEALVENPIERALAAGGAPHPAIPLPPHLFPDGRENSLGFDWSSEPALRTLSGELEAFAATAWHARPTSAPAQSPSRPDGATVATLATVAIGNPALPGDTVGTVQNATATDIASSLARAQAAAGRWSATPGRERAATLRACAAALQRARTELIALAVREAGKTLGNALGEVREAIDFCRYYAAQLEAALEDPAGPTGPEEPPAPLVCISPWNFPLAIFTGQVAAALAAGRVVLAKPAEQTPLIAARAVELFHAAGVPEDVLLLVPGDGTTVGAALVASESIGGVLFTGSTGVARSIARTLARTLHAPVLIAETGGQNAMLVDSSALTEQVVQDIVTSAFDSAGQRCSALRLLCIQDDVAEATLSMLIGAMTELTIGNPAALACDIGPVIDTEAQERLLDHIEAMRTRGHRVTQVTLPASCAAGTFVAPTLIEIDAVTDLPGEVFGPILHVLRYRFGELESVVEAVNRTGYGLTMGVHSRIDEHIDSVRALGHVGNLYVNRNMVGAVVGVQPFGGEGLSGTGPKAGGPLYLERLGGPLGQELAQGLAPQAGHDPETRPTEDRDSPSPAVRWHEAVLAAPELTEEERAAALAALARAHAARLVERRCALPGPTGEINVLWFSPRTAVGCVSDERSMLLAQIGTVLACKGQPYAAQHQLPRTLAAFVLPLNENDARPSLDAVLVHGSGGVLKEWSERVADGAGPLIPVIPFSGPHAVAVAARRLVHERTISTNTAAAGGNASLMTLGE